MPKANLKDAYYFSHDSNARNDEKILAMRSVYGLPGYAMYFMLVEILREQTDYKLKIGKYTFPTLSVQIQCDKNDLKQFVEDCCTEFELFTIENDFLYSESLLRRMKIVDEVSEKRKKASETRWNNANAMQMDSKCNANAMQMDSKEEEKKRKETKREDSKEKEIKHIIPPESDWVRDYCKERNNGIGANEFIDFYESKGWLVGKSKMKDWQATIRTWEKNRNIVITENKEPPKAEEPTSRFAPLTDEERKMFFDRGAFSIEPSEYEPHELLECVDFGALTEQEREYLHEKGVI